MKYLFPFPPRTLRCNVGFNDIILPSVHCEQESISHFQWALRAIGESRALCFWGLFLCLSKKALSLPWCLWCCVFITKSIATQDQSYDYQLS